MNLKTLTYFWGTFVKSSGQCKELALHFTGITFRQTYIHFKEYYELFKYSNIPQLCAILGTTMLIPGPLQNPEAEHRDTTNAQHDQVSLSEQTTG